MPKNETLPAEVHDHFAKANVLHGYCMKAVKESVSHAVDVGNELLAAKAAIPHGRWEEDCDKFFDASLRTAQVYMQLAKHLAAIPKAQKNAIMYLESTIEGASKAAKQASKPTAPKRPPKPPETPPEPEPDSEPAPPPKAPPKAAQGQDYGKCPACAGTKWTHSDDGTNCNKCGQPWGEPAGDTDEDRIKTQKSKTIKTCDALLRAFDDLQVMHARPEYDEAILRCKQLLAIARNWC